MSTRDEYVEILKSVALTAAKKAVMQVIISKLPSLASGLLGNIVTPVIGMFVGWVLEYAIKYTEMGAFFLYIDLRTSAQGREFEKYARANFEAQKNGTPEEKAKAEKELVDASRAFFKLSN